MGNLFGSGTGAHVPDSFVRQLEANQQSQFDSMMGPLSGAIDAQGNLIQQNIGALGGLNTQLGGLGSQLGGIGQQYAAIAAGDDPRFAAFQEAQLAQLGAQREGAANQQNTTLGRQGIGGSVALNEQNALAENYDLREQSLTSGLGLQQMARQDQALAGQAGIIGQQGGLLGAQTGMGQLGVQNELAIPTLNIANTAANNQGGGGGKK